MPLLDTAVSIDGKGDSKLAGRYKSLCWDLKLTNDETCKHYGGCKNIMAQSFGHGFFKCFKEKKKRGHFHYCTRGEVFRATKLLFLLDKTLPLTKTFNNKIMSFGTLVNVLHIVC